VDKSTKTVVVKAADGTEHALKVADQATIHGTKEGFDGLKEVGYGNYYQARERKCRLPTGKPARGQQRHQYQSNRS